MDSQAYDICVFTKKRTYLSAASARDYCFEPGLEPFVCIYYRHWHTGHPSPRQRLRHLDPVTRVRCTCAVDAYADEYHTPDCAVSLAYGSLVLT